MIGVPVGVLVGVLAIILARAMKWERWVYSMSLIALPGIYLLFAWFAGDPATAMKELVFGAPFFVAGVLFAIVSLPDAARIVGALWLLHGVYDLTHEMFFTNAGAPNWYPVFCASVDFVIGFYLLWLYKRVKKSGLHAA